MKKMPSYRIKCYTPECEADAVYKIAARWSDGAMQELKTYACACDDCLPDWYRRSCAKQMACRLTVGETLDVPSIFRLQRGERDRKLERQPDLEKSLQAAAPES